MGHSFLSIRFGVVIAVFVAVLVTVHGQVTAGMGTHERAAEVPEAIQRPVEAGEEAVACLWRGCPVLAHPLLRAAAPVALRSG
jgi:hypothetical protein